MAREPSTPREAPAADRIWSLRLVDARGDAVVDARLIVGGTGPGPALRARSDGLGLARLRVPPRIADHEPLLVVTGQRGGLAWRPLPSESGFLGEVRLDEAIGKRGTLTLPDGSPAERTTLRFTHVALLGDADGRATALFRALVEDGHLVAMADADVDPLGRFEVQGLDPGVYLVESRLPGAEGFERLFLSSHRASLLDVVRGPERLELTVDGLLAELVLYDRDYRDVAGAAWRIDGVDVEGVGYEREFVSPPGQGAVEVWLPPSRSLRVRGSRGDLAAAGARVDLEEGAGGVVRVEAA
ncbi:MAG: hypothetical protein AAFZ65_20480, partial [Planctomycetota bacterium]